VSPSSHIWTARLPAELEPGTHCIAVRVVDEYGREHRDRLVRELIVRDRTMKGGAGDALVGATHRTKANR
jgi:hypothetical protein